MLGSFQASGSVRRLFQSMPRIMGAPLDAIADFVGARLYKVSCVMGASLEGIPRSVRALRYCFARVMKGLLCSVRWMRPRIRARRAATNGKGQPCGETET
jgi:hypothetical protein